MNDVYIRMCQGAVELQDIWKNKPENQIKGGEQLIWKKWKEPLDPGNLWILPEWDDYIDMVDPFQPCPFLLEFREEYVWLPRQEDLQELFRHKNGNPDEYWILKSFLVWFSHLTGYPKACPDREVSITQLWLQYVMETVYQKRWNGESWEEIVNGDF